MRLHSLSLRNYRVHKELSITFDAARNLIGGPNESGKSTLAEAIHRSLFLRAKTGGSLREQMRSTLHGGEPEIDLIFEACDLRWTIEKRFAGAKGSALLSNTSGDIYKDDEAETKLSEILRCDTNGGRLNNNQLSALWSHLWVWQGSSGSDPSGHASNHKDTLVQRLQQDGLASVMQSTTDQLVRERITASYDELFTSRGLRAGSKPELARAHLAQAEVALERAQEIAGRLEESAADYLRAEAEITEIDALLPNFRQQKAAVETKLSEVEKLRRQEESQLQQWQTAATTYKQLCNQDADIIRLHEQVVSARDILAPAERLEASLTTEEKHAAGLNQEAELSQRENADAVRLARLRLDLATSSIAEFEKATDHHRLADRSAEAVKLQNEIASHRESLSQLANISAKDLESLRQLDRSASQASLSLDAMATGIELLTSELPVILDDQVLAPGEARTLTDAGELIIGTHTRLRIRPGGGISLADARMHQEKSQRALTDRLDQYALRDLDHAIGVLQQRQTLTQQIAHLETRWKALGGEFIATELASANIAYEAAKAEVQRRLATFDPPPALPQDLEAAHQERSTFQQALERIEESETNARHQATLLRQRLETATKNLNHHRDQTSQARQSLSALETKLQVLQETHGSTATREASLAQATLQESSSSTLLAETRQSIIALAPDLLAADLDRFTRAISQNESRRREVENLHLIARERLTLDGSNDPHAELAHAQARHAAALVLNDSEQRRAKAIEQLQQLFSSSREAIDRSIVQPLADRISGYLRCLFGHAAQIRINISEAGIEGLDLIRPNDPAFSFETLSGGAKEQVAAAVRLAMAEILAADHNDCLPIVLDDAFAYTDPDRVQVLQRMLDLAASRGLQIIVLSCNPADYSAFGAREVRLKN